MEAKKPTMRDLRNRHHFSIPQVKGLSDLPELAIYHMLMNVPVPRDIAIRVLEQISEMTRLEYTLENVAVTLLPDDVPVEDALHTKWLPTFQEVRRQNQITLNMLIEDTQLPPDEVLRVDGRGIGTAEAINMLLESLSRMVGQSYTRRNVGGFHIIFSGEETDEEVDSHMEET